ncbi:MAG: alpha/beta hydrolase [Acetobacteraceae bacterium]
MRRTVILALITIAVCCLPAVWRQGVAAPESGAAQGVGCTPSGRDPRTVAVIVLYAGHTFPIRAPGVSDPAPGTSVLWLRQALRGAGFMVMMPEMPWTVSHPYDRSLGETLDDIAAIAATLKARGAAKVFVVGHSLGGGVALAFGARRGHVAGVAALAGGPNPSSRQQRTARRASVAKARAMVQAGHGDQEAEFVDVNGPHSDLVRTTAADYLSFFSPHSALSVRRNLARWPTSLPLLWIDGTDETRLPARVKMVRRHLPANGLSRYLTVNATHTSVADASTSDVVAWLRCF